MNNQQFVLMITGSVPPVIALSATLSGVPWRISVRASCRFSPLALTALMILFLMQRAWIYAGITYALDVIYILCGYWTWPTLSMAIDRGEQSKSRKERKRRWHKTPNTGALRCSTGASRMMSPCSSSGRRTG